MPTSQDVLKSRVVHIPLTNSEWLALRRLAVDRNSTIGLLASSAIQRTYRLTEGTTK